MFQESIKLIKEFEGLSLTPYKCAGGMETIGYGHINREKYDEISELHAENLLKYDIERVYYFIKNHVKVNLNNNQWTAIISFVFNVGMGNFERSTLLKKLNNREYLSVPSELLRWIHIGKVKSKGLLRRRLAEATLFIS